MLLLQNSSTNQLKISRIKIIRYELLDADLCIQTYGTKKDGYIQAATSSRLIEVLKRSLYDEKIKIIFIDTLYTICGSEELNRIMRFLCVKGVRIYSMWFEQIYI